MMAIGSSLAVFCAEAIDDDAERALVLRSLTSDSGKAVLEISRGQVPS